MTLLDGLAGLDPEARRELATNLRQVSATFHEVPDGKTTSHGSASWLTCSTRPDQLVDLYRIWHICYTRESACGQPDSHVTASWKSVSEIPISPAAVEHL